METIKDQILAKLVFESIASKGAITIEEAQFFDKITSEILESVFSTITPNEEIVSIEESFGQNVEEQPSEVNESEKIEQPKIEETSIVSKLLTVKL